MSNGLSCDYHITSNRIQPSSRVGRLLDKADDEPASKKAGVSIHSASEIPPNNRRNILPPITLYPTPSSSVPAGRPPPATAFDLTLPNLLHQPPSTGCPAPRLTAIAPVPPRLHCRPNRHHHRAAADLLHPPWSVSIGSPETMTTAASTTTL